MYIALGFVLCVLIALAVLRNKDRKFISELDAGEHPLRFLYPISAFVYELLGRLGVREQITDKDAVERLKVGKPPEEAVKEDSYRIIAYIVAVLAVTALLAAACVISYESPMTEDGIIRRNETGEGELEVELSVRREEEETGKDIVLPVSEAKCPPEELEDYFKKAYRRLEQDVIGSNASADSITGNLALVNSISDMPVSVSWPDIDEDYIYPDGSVRRDRFTEPVVVNLTARLCYFDEVRLYSFSVRLIPEESDEAAEFTDRLLAMLKEEDLGSADTGYLRLPAEFEGTKLHWSGKANKTPLTVAVMGILMAVCIIPASKAELKRKERLREEEMLAGYPDIISKYIILITAGMTCRGAWEKICEDYRQNVRNKDARKPYLYAYEEMLISRKELSYGIPEVKVYENFANRCKVPEYQRFGNLLAKNLRRGSRDITSILELEAEEAFNKRKESVRMKGEEAGTKLLFPMIGMLVIVIAIVVVPAFGSFGI